VQIQPGAGDAALQRNGEIVVSGDFGLVRYLPDGKLDTGFGIHGLAPTTFSVSGLAIQPDGDTVAVGQSRGPLASSRSPSSPGRELPTWPSVTVV